MASMASIALKTLIKEEVHTQAITNITRNVQMTILLEDIVTVNIQSVTCFI